MSGTFDFEDKRPHSVYRCFMADGTLLYIGCARNVADRMFHQLQPCNMGKQPNGMLQRHMDRWTAVEYATKALAREAERKAIQAEAPLLNRQHNPKRFRKSADRRGYDFVGEVHPISREAFEVYSPVTLEEQREALAAISDMFPHDGAA